MKTNSSALTDADVIVTSVELNNRHGVGILLNRIFADRDNLIVLRTDNLYGGESPLGTIDYVLEDFHLNREQIYQKVAAVLKGHTVRRILCIPYYREEVLMALAVREITNAPICCYLMDDRNLLDCGISTNLMRELLEKSQLCLGISSPMCSMYRLKYGKPVYFVPPIVSPDLVNTSIPPIAPEILASKRGAIVGNVWSAEWLKLLRILVKETGIKLDWYGNSGSEWHLKDRETLSEDGIIERGFLPTEQDLARELRNYAFAIVPSGTLDDRDDNFSISWLSLPSRIPFIVASTNTPILVLGNDYTTAAQFVRQFQIGLSSNYELSSFQQAIDTITTPTVQIQMRTNAANLAPYLTQERMADWLWKSLKLGQPIDDRFEQLFADNFDRDASLRICLQIIHDRQQEIKQLRSIPPQLQKIKENKFWQLIRSTIRRFKLKLKRKLKLK
jgi:hypothetical protein